MRGEDGQICPLEASGAKEVKLLKHGALQTYPGFPHGVTTTSADQINAELQAFIKS
jgi:non-heme chloroperoxidase